MEKRNHGWEHQKQIEGYGNYSFDGDYTKFKKKQLGEARFNALMVRANTSQKFKTDKKEMAKYFREELKKLLDKRIVLK